ncbi:MAG: cobyrinate a,c-diamide synthase [Desulfovibrionaceae bacterium]|nr:cobyrinate a,c-diamide synthase [Desulfovibrionaceae bacterium]
MRSGARLIFSATSGSSGKTLVTVGLAAFLRRRGFSIAACKKGPDYIDSEWLSVASGSRCVNLDPFFLEKGRLLSLFSRTAADADITLIEGNRGLLDGSIPGGTTADLAELLQAPTVIVLNIACMADTAAAVMAGLSASAPVHGVLLNRCGSFRHAEAARRAIESKTGIPVLGALPRMEENPLPERRMGLPLFDDPEETEQLLEHLSDWMEQNADIDSLLGLARSASELPVSMPFWPEDIFVDPVFADPIRLHGWKRYPPIFCSGEPNVRIGFVQDQWLRFYYGENLEALRRSGAELVELNLSDIEHWPSIDGLYLGSGIPDFFSNLESLREKLAVLRHFSEEGMPIYAEGGSFVLLGRTFRKNAETAPMSGIFPLDFESISRPGNLGYVTVEAARETPFHPAGSIWRGHSFHYVRCLSRNTEDGWLRLRRRPFGRADDQETYADGYAVRRTFGTFVQLYAPAVPHWASRFVALCQEWASERKSCTEFAS